MMGIHLRLCVQTTEQRWESTPTAPNNSLTAYRIHQHPRRNISPNNLVCRSLLPSATLYDLYDLQIPYEQVRFRCECAVIYINLNIIFELMNECRHGRGKSSSLKIFAATTTLKVREKQLYTLNQRVSGFLFLLLFS